MEDNRRFICWLTVTRRKWIHIVRKPQRQKNLPIAVFYSTHAIHDIVVPPAGVLISVDKVHHAEAMTPVVADNLTLVLSVVESLSDRWRAGGTMTQVVGHRSAPPSGIHYM